MNKTNIIDEINNISNDFLDWAIKLTEISPYKRIRRTVPGFPVLGTANKEYYEYNYYERHLESAIREQLVNRVFAFLFGEYDINATWPEFDKIYVGFSNEHIEDIHPFEFRIEKDGYITGYRYTSFCESEEETEKILEEHGVSKIVVIKWENNIRNESCINYVEEITIGTFLESFFGEDIKTIVMDSLVDVIRKANSEIGFQTIPRLSLRNLSDFRDQSLTEFNEKNYQSLVYEIVDDKGNLIPWSEYCLSDDDKALLNEYFIEKDLYEAFYGSSEFSKCFVTAEYLYSIFKEGNRFDYTAVICGYLKAVEQLVYQIFKTTLERRPSENVLMKLRNAKYRKKDLEYVLSTRKKKDGTDAWHIPFLPKNEKYFDITLAPLIWLLHDHNGVWRISEDGRQVIHNVLMRYSQECRNDHFHKDNIDEYTIVKSIRNNTILIFFLLLGGCKLTNSDEENKRILGIQDSEYTHLYKDIRKIPRSQDRFVFVSGGQETKVLRLFDQPPTIYNSSGSVEDSVMIFAKVNNYHIDDYEEFLEHLKEIDIITLSAVEIPDEIWLVLRTTGERRLIYSKK